MAQLSSEQALAAAWTMLAPGRDKELVPRGFWPDLARVAIEIYAQQTLEPTLNFRPTLCSSKREPPHRVKRTVDLSQLQL